MGKIFPKKRWFQKFVSENLGGKKLLVKCDFGKQAGAELC